MKKIATLIICLLSVGNISAQDFEKGGNYITLGFGVDPYHTYRGNLGVGPIMVNYERGITDILGIGRIGVGGGVAYSIYNGKYINGSKYSGYRFSIIARAAYHFEFDVPKMDVYAGIGAAVHIYHEPYDNDFFPGSYNDRVIGGHYIFAGIRYYFTDAFGVYAEVGHGVSALNGGIVFAF